MKQSIARAAVAGHANAIDHADPSGSSVVDLAEMRTWIARAIADSGWNQEALAVAMGKDKAYVSRVLSGEKPLSASFLRALPNDIERIVARSYAQAFGLVVAEPLTGPAAIEAIVGAVVGLLSSPRMPSKADAMVSVDLDGKSRKRA